MSPGKATGQKAGRSTSKKRGQNGTWSAEDRSRLRSAAGGLVIALVASLLTQPAWTPVVVVGGLLAGLLLSYVWTPLALIGFGAAIGAELLTIPHHKGLVFTVAAFVARLFPLFIGLVCRDLLTKLLRRRPAEVLEPERLTTVVAGKPVQAGLSPEAVRSAVEALDGGRRSAAMVVRGSDRLWVLATATAGDLVFVARGEGSRRVLSQLVPEGSDLSDLPAVKVASGSNEFSFPVSLFVTRAAAVDAATAFAGDGSCAPRLRWVEDGDGFGVTVPPWLDVLP